MTITEDVESEYRSELKLWENSDGDIWIQVGYDDDDPYTTQGMAISPDDARALINELSRLLRKMGHQPTINQRSTEGKGTCGHQLSTNNQPGYQLSL